MESQKLPDSLFITDEEAALINNCLQSNQTILLQCAEVRNILATCRLKRVAPSEIKTLQGHDQAVITNAIEHNLDGLQNGYALTRPELLIGPLFSLDYVRRNILKLKFLSVGPRSEAEIFSLLARGVQTNNIRGLDLISYSPFVDLGDMHAMPYPDQSFDVIILGWVLAYSKNHKKVREEILRVAKPGAVIAIGCEYNPMSTEDLMKSGGVLKDDYPRFYHTDDILKIFDGVIDDVFFKHDVMPELRQYIGSVMTIFRLKKPWLQS